MWESFSNRTWKRWKRTRLQGGEVSLSNHDFDLQKLEFYL